MAAIRVLSLFGIIIFLFSKSLTGQIFRSNDADKLVKDSKLVRLNPRNNTIRFIQLREDAKVEDKDHKIWLGKTLKISHKHSFKEVSRGTDHLGYIHYKYQLYFKNLPVEGEIYNVHSKAGKISSANGDYTPGKDVNEVPGLTEQQAFNAAIKFVSAKQYRWEKENLGRPVGELVILPVDERYVLVYKFDIYALIPLSRQFIFIDANSGKVLKTINRIQNENVVGTAETMYNGTVNITADSYSGHYRLRETGRGQGIETYDLNKGNDLTYAVDFTDNDNHWNASENFDKAAYDAHYATEVTYDFYSRNFDRNSYDNSGAKVISYVHYNENYCNAFWDGNVIWYGDGDNVRYLPFTPIEVVAHEITHAVIQKSAGLIYEGESGALNESFSDIFGITIDFNKNPSVANYRMGDAMSLTNTAFRDISNPNSYNDPDTYKGSYWDKDQEVHSNSGVQNYWYYLLCEGGSGTNDIGNSFQVNGIGRDKAIQIAYRNLTVYLSPNSDYTDARFYSVQSAKDLFGDCSSEATATSAAWYAVGIGDANDCFSPENFTATQISRSQVTLSWTKNVSNNNVLIAGSTSRNIGNPSTQSVYSPGSLIPGGGVVIYSGSASNFNHSGLNPGIRYYYKAWSITSENSYSGGVSTTVMPPVIEAGMDQKLVLPLETTLSLSCKYPEGLPKDSLTFKWEKINGQGDATFDNADSLKTIVHFNEVGKYTIQLSVDYFGLISFDSVHVIVSLTDSITNYIFPGYHNHMGLEVQGNYAFLADLVYGFRIIDISEYENPIPISGFEKFNVNSVHVENDCAYVSFLGGMMILNIKDKTNPTLISKFDVPNETENHGFIVNKGIVYYASIPDGLIVIDITNVTDPVKIGGFQCAPMTISLIDNYLYITERISQGLGPILLDISDPGNPRKVAEFPKIYAEWTAPDEIQGEYLYRCETTIDREKGYFLIYNISNRLNPVKTGSTDIFWNNSSISIQGNYAYLNDGLRVIDISDKSLPVEVSNEYATTFTQVIARNNLIYCTRDGEFVIYKSYLDNRAPYIYAGTDKSIDSLKSTLHGEIFDEGLPLGAKISSTWSKKSGPGTITFSDVHDVNSTVSFSDTGKYIIRLTAHDGELSSYDEVQYNVKFAISQQPDTLTACEYTDAEFMIEVKSKTSVVYRWIRDNIALYDVGNISGTGTNRLIIHNVSVQETGTYWCQVSNGSIFESNKALLTVHQFPEEADRISGNNALCKEEINVVYSTHLITGADSYIWTIPPGTSGTSTTNNITISFEDSAASGVIKVKGHNECGNGKESILEVTLIDIPAKPEITFNTGVLQSNANNGNQWYLDNKPIQNAVNQTLIPQSGGDYFVIVKSGNCSSLPSNTITCSPTGLNVEVIDNGISVYPNPTEDAIKVVVNHKFNSDFNVEVYSKTGKLLRSMRKAETEYIFDVDLTDLPAGLYLIRLYNSDNHYQIKVIKK